MSAELHYQGLCQVGELIRSGKTSSVAVTESMFARIEALDKTLHSYVVLMKDSALAEARRADQEISQGKLRGPLQGVPIAIKDLLWTADAPTAFGTTIFRDFQAKEDGTVVKRLRDAGAVILGKVQLTEGALTDHHPDLKAPINPWNPAHWSGASSSGSGVAPAAGLCYGAIGTDTGGSIRFPSNACGVTGLKPTWGRVSRYGAFELGASLDHIGPMTRNVPDAAVMLNAIAGYDERDPTSSHLAVPDYLAEMHQGIKGLRVGLDPDWNGKDVDEATQVVMAAAAEVLAKAGATIVKVKAPDPIDMQTNWFNYCGVEAAVVHEATYPKHKESYGWALTQLLEAGHGQSAMDFQKLILQRMDFVGRFRHFMRDIDVMLLPATAIASPTAAQMNVQGEAFNSIWFTLMRFTAFVDMAGLPSLTIPGGFTQHGTPIGFQLLSSEFQESLVIRAGQAFQQLTDWHTRHPQLNP